jgi:CheY-like chemotaxis protein
MNIPAGPLLVVEDIDSIRQLLEVTLRFKGYPVVSARNGQEALECIERETPALVITDILMPLLDGYSLAQKIRTNPLTRRLPIIFLSATYVSPEDKSFALSLGAVRFLEKPVDTEEFLLTVAEVLTGDPPNGKVPLSSREFHLGYQERLEHKLRHKNTQIARTKRLLTSLPCAQQPAFEQLLEEAITQLSQIQGELDRLYSLTREENLSSQLPNRN